MGWAQVGISPDRGVRISWRNQFIGNLWGVRSGRLIPGDQVLSVLPALDLSVSTVSTYRDDGAPADRRLLTRHGRRDKYRTPINSPLPFRATWANVARGNWLQGRRADLLRPRDLPRSKPSRPMPEGSPSRRLPKRRSRGTKPKLGRAPPPRQRSRAPGRGSSSGPLTPTKGVSRTFLTDSRPFHGRTWPNIARRKRLIRARSIKDWITRGGREDLRPATRRALHGSSSSARWV